MKRLIPKKAKELFLKVLKSNNSTQDIADGLAIGVFVALLPIMGIQMYVSLALTGLFKKNPWIAMLVAWITNPLTAVPIYWFNLWVGNLIYRHPVSFTELRDIVLSLDFSNILAAGKDILIPLWIGSVLVGIVVAVISQKLCLKYYDRMRERCMDWAHRELHLK